MPRRNHQSAHPPSLFATAATTSSSTPTGAAAPSFPTSVSSPPAAGPSSPMGSSLRSPTTSLRARRFPTLPSRTSDSQLMVESPTSPNSSSGLPQQQQRGPTDSFADSTGSYALYSSPTAGSAGSPMFPLVDPNVTVCYPTHQRGDATDGGDSRGARGDDACSVGHDANADRAQVRVEGYFDRDVGVLVPSDLPRSTLLYVMTASDGRDLMFKMVQYSLQLTMCVIKMPSLFSPEARVFVDPWADRFFRNYNTIRHGRSLFKVGRGVLNLFTLQTVIERMWRRYGDRVLVYLAPVLRRLCHAGYAVGVPGCAKVALSSPTTATALLTRGSDEGVLADSLTGDSRRSWAAWVRSFFTSSSPQTKWRRSSHFLADTLMTDDMYSNVSRVERSAQPLRVSPTQRAATNGTPDRFGSDNMTTPTSQQPGSVMSTAMPFYVRGTTSPVPGDGSGATPPLSTNPSFAGHHTVPYASAAAAPINAAAAAAAAAIAITASHLEDPLARSSWSAASPTLATVPPTPDRRSTVGGDEDFDDIDDASGEEADGEAEERRTPTQQKTPLRDSGSHDVTPLHATPSFETGSYGMGGTSRSVHSDSAPPLLPGTLPLELHRPPGTVPAGIVSAESGGTLLQPLQHTTPPKTASDADALTAAVLPTTAATACSLTLGCGSSYLTSTKSVPFDDNLDEHLRQQDSAVMQRRPRRSSTRRTSAVVIVNDILDTDYESSAQQERPNYNDSEVSMNSSSESDSGVFKYVEDALEPASAADPERWRKPPMQFNPFLMSLIGLRNLTAACRRFMRDLTMISSERFFVFDYVENNRVRIHRRINYLWLIISAIDLFLNTVRLAQPGWFRYAMARQDVNCHCACGNNEDPSDVVWRSNNLIARRKTDLFFPPLNLDYGAPFASNVAFLEAADPVHMQPACSRCGYLYKENTEGEREKASGGWRHQHHHHPKHGSTSSGGATSGGRGGSGGSLVPRSSALDITESPTSASPESSVGFLFLPWMMRKVSNYLWLMRMHPNLTSTLLLEARYMAELFLAYKYCFGDYEPNRRDAPMSQILKPGGAVAGLISAAVGLLRVVESAPH